MSVPKAPNSTANSSPAELRKLIDQLRQAIREGADDWRLHNALGDALMAAGRDEEAIGDYMLAVKLNPQLGDVCIKIGKFFLVRGLTDPAWDWFQRALRIDPAASSQQTPEVGNRSSEIRQELATLLEEWVTADPNDRDREYLSHALLGEQSAKKAPDEYVSKLFDNYAEKFDDHLKRLGYRGPELIAKALAEDSPSPPEGWDMLDIGCGTGLVGQLVRALANRLVGVDLSEKMVEKAGERDVYDELCATEMNGLMRARPGQFDVVTAGDVLTYLGDLTEFGAAVAATLRPQGRLFAIFEALADETGTPGYSLHPTGRFSHGEVYVRGVLQQHGFHVRIASREASRINHDKPVPSFLVVAQLPAAS